MAEKKITILRFAPAALGFFVQACGNAPAIPNPQFNPNTLTPLGRLGKNLLPQLAVLPLTKDDQASQQYARELIQYQSQSPFDFEHGAEFIGATIVSAAKPSQENNGSGSMQMDFALLAAKGKDNTPLLYVRYADGNGNSVIISSPIAKDFKKYPDGSISFPIKAGLITIMEDFFYPVYNPDGSLNFEETSKRLFKTVISDPKNGEQFVIENKVANNDVPRPIPTADSGQTVGQLRIAFTPRQPTAENVPIGPMIKIGEALIPAPSADLLKTTPDSAIGQYAKALGLNADAVKGELTYEQRGNLVFAKAKDGTPLFIATQDQKSGEWGWNNLNLRTADEKTGAIYGSEALTGGNDNVRLKVIKEHFNQMTITGLSWKRSQPSEKDLELRIPNSYLKDAIINKQDVTFLHLVYGINSETPDWLRNGNYTKDQLIRIMHDHITNIMTSNRKIVDDAGSNIQLQYSVVNEGVDQPNYFWSSRIGPSYIQSAFQTARTADPKAILIYNDYAHELPTARKTDRVFQVVKELKDKQLIDGVGMQMHFIGKDNLDPNLPIQYLEEGIRSQIKRYGEIGVKVYITELDVDLSKISGSPVEKMQKAAEIYRMIARISSSSSNVAGVSVFGVNSESSWITDLGGKAALLFSNNQPLPTYYATLTGLMEGLK